MNKGSDEIVRIQGPQYPMLAFETALERVRSLVSAIGDRHVTRAEAIAAMGFKSIGGNAKRALAALKLYGLVARDPHGYAATPIGLKLSRDPNDQTARQAAVWTPSINRKLRSKFGLLDFSDQDAIDHLEHLGYQRAASLTILTNYRRIAVDGEPHEGRVVRAVGEAVRNDASDLEHPPQQSQATAQRELYRFSFPSGASLAILQVGDVDASSIAEAVGVWLKIWDRKQRTEGGR